MLSTNNILESAPLTALRDYNILETPAEESFDRITRLAKLALRVPIALISLVDRNRQSAELSQRIDARATPRLASFCTLAIAQDDVYIVPNTLDHPAFCNNSLVAGERNIGFYAGIPLQLHNGLKIGTLCAADHQQRELTTDQIRILRDLARLTIDEIELRQIATTDSLIGALTRRGFEIEISREAHRSERHACSLSAIAVDVDHFKKINDNYGHAAGDMVLKAIVSQIKQELRTEDFLGRLGGEEFVIGLPETDADNAMIVAERIRQRIEDTTVQSAGDTIQVTASFGIAEFSRADQDWLSTLGRADVALYQAKQNGRNRCLCHQPDLELF
jgi:diguanylate cyclase (GGDEF)-like protein